MRMTKITNRIFSLLFMASLVLACSKDGDIGPIGPEGPKGEQGPKGDKGDPGQDSAAANQGEQGPAGPQGVQGEKGDNGEDGEDGETGTANVIYSPWIPSGFEDNIQSHDAIFTIDAPLLTDKIIQQGVVLAYGKIITASDEDVLPLPVTIPTTNESYYHRIEDVGELQIRIMSLDLATNIGSSLFAEYRYVLIPGGVSTGKSASTINYSKMTYEEVAERFSIPD